MAPDLLGCLLIGAPGVTLRITEVEAYGSADDPASHAFRRTARSAVMFGPPGRLYVYLSYGMHWCANLVTGPDGSASAVLLRAAEVVAGHERARTLRPATSVDARLGRGPASVATLLGVTGALTGDDLCRPGRSVQVRVGDRPEDIASGPRVGITKAADRPWRFFVPGAPSVSAFRPGAPRRRSGA